MNRSTTYFRVMGVTKTELFTEQQNRLAELAKAFAHPARVAILQVLIARRTCICGDLVDELNLAQATVSQHLNELKRIGLIRGTIEPPRVCYCVDETVWAEAQRAFGALLTADVSRTCC